MNQFQIFSSLGSYTEKNANRSEGLYQNVFFGDSKSVLSSNSDLTGLLSTDEIERMNRFRNVADRDAYLAAHGMLRKYMYKVDQRLKKPEISFFETQKPYVKGVEIDFNISHSESLFAFIIAGSSDLNVGIDIEVIKPFEGMRDVALRNFSGKEVSYVYHPEIILEEQLIRFYEIWTRKEAFLKMIGLGLYTELTNISVTHGKNSVLIELPPHIKVKGDNAFIFTQRFSNFIVSVSLSEECSVLFEKLES